MKSAFLYHLRIFHTKTGRYYEIIGLFYKQRFQIEIAKAFYLLRSSKRVFRDEKNQKGPKVQKNGLKKITSVIWS